jgi:hypothetical protein
MQQAKHHNVLSSCYPILWRDRPMDGSHAALRHSRAAESWNSAEGRALWGLHYDVGASQELMPEAALTAVQGEAFGCPYKTLSVTELTEALLAMHLPPRTVEEAVTKARGHHYQLACTAVFQGKHNCICESGISHPNQVRMSDSTLQPPFQDCPNSLHLPAQR